MDFLGYSSYWNDSGEIPDERINVGYHIWDMSKGETFFRDFKYPDIICKKVKYHENVSDEMISSHFVAPPTGDIYGHHVVKDSTVTEFSNEESDFIPIMPNYVRDLAGRIICIAECFPIQMEPSVTGRFPKNAFHIGEGYEGYNLIDNVYFSFFRTLDVSADYKYSNPNLHPYKLRVDTFYQDGWRVPQTELLFIKENDNKADLDSAIKDLQQKWDSSFLKNDYERFYEDVGGEDFFNSLFERGVTLIPTLEGYNANNIVDREFTLQDYESGKFVPEFHEVVSYQSSEKPVGTIIKVIEYGYATEYEIRKAKIIVSNGDQYVSPNKEDPNPLYPDLRLPHNRVTSKWGDVYIPTHPKHFENAAIWGWDFKTGTFCQIKGPLWDPVHYYYKSVDKIIDIYQGEPMDENYWLYKVENEEKFKFYPVIPFAGLDVFSEDEQKERQKYLVRPYTVCKRYEKDEFSTGVGYHPMPAEFEIELDSWCLPELKPSNRINSEVPLNIRNVLAPVALCNISARDYIDIQKEVDNSFLNIIDENDEIYSSQGESIKDYPYLCRYLQSITSITKMEENLKIFFYDSYEFEEYSERGDYLGELKIPKDINQYIPDMSLAYYEFKDLAYKSIEQKRYMFEHHEDDVFIGIWNSSKVEDFQCDFREESIQEFDNLANLNVAIMQPPTF